VLDVVINGEAMVTESICFGQAGKFHGTAKFRAMHCYPDRFKRYMDLNPVAVPQAQRGLRGRAYLVEACPVVGLVPGVPAKKTRESRYRHARHLKRQGGTVQ
jgi:hypothetical protein